MKSVTTLEKWEANWETLMGAWFPGERVVVRGKDLFTDLRNVPLMAYIIFGITGKIPSKEQTVLYEAIWSLGASFPDPRLWNNRIATLAGTARSTSNLGISAGIAVSEATIYGARPIYAIAVMLNDIQLKLKNGEPLKSILETRLALNVKGIPGIGKNRDTSTIPGYGRPLTKIDERLPPLFNLLDELGLNNTPNLKLILDIERTLKDDLHLERSMNIAAFACAYTIDQGLTPRQAYQVFALAFSPGILICNIDSEAHPEGSFFPTRCEQITYLGKPLRQWQDP